MLTSQRNLDYASHQFLRTKKIGECGLPGYRRDETFFSRNGEHLSQYATDFELYFLIPINIQTVFFLWYFEILIYESIASVFKTLK